MEKKPSGTLDYGELYAVAEELRQLVGCRLQAVTCVSDTRYALEFWTRDDGARWLLIDLTPARPLILSISSTKLKRQKHITPVHNFLKAHFVGRLLENLEIAQKPDRLLRLTFKKNDDDEKDVLFEFKCFPHGQHLMLSAAGKFIQSPLRPRPLSTEQRAFVEPEAASGWELCERWAERLLKPAEAVKPAAGIAAGGEPSSYAMKLKKKLTKAIAALDEGAKKGLEEDTVKIAELENQAAELKNAGPESGARIQAVYGEIKKIKRKTLMNAARRNELEQQLERLEKNPQIQPRAALEKTGAKKKKEKDSFSGTRVRLDGTFELWVGRSDWQNDDLVRLCSPQDLWIHLRDYPGAHGVIRGPKKGQPTPAQVEFSCRVVAILSARKKKPFNEGEMLDFIVTPRKFVKKPKGAAPGRVTVERESVRRVAYKTVRFDVD